MAVAQRCSLASFPVLRASGSTERLSFGSGRKPFSALKQPRPRSLQEFQVDVRTPLGRGACSVVFAGTHRKTDFSVAIKAMSCAMPTERGALPVATGIANESQVFRHLLERTGGNSHPNVVELIGCFDGDGREASDMGLEVPQEERVHYFVTERLEGGSMDELLSPDGVPEDSARAVARKVCEGLASLHEQGVVHRDLKPGNVLFSKSDTGEAIPKLIDFSHAAVAKDGEESLRGELGTRGYVAPEVLAEKPYGSKCDVFSLGCVVHALLSGRPPRRCLRIGMVQQLPAAVSREARAFLARLLALNALERPSAQEALSEPWMKE